MVELNVGATKFNEKLMVRCVNNGLSIQFEYESGNHFPSIPLRLNWAEWERFVAWVELQRKEDALKSG